MNYKVIKTVRIKPQMKKPTFKSKNIDFDPFDIYPDNIQHNKPILLVDLGYVTFYRFNATKTWYKHSHPEEKEEVKKEGYEWGDNKEFMEKFSSQYVKCIQDIAKKFKVPEHNVIMAQDCSSCDNWRNDLFADYKLTRKEQREKTGFDGAKVFKYVFDVLLEGIVKNYGFKLFKHNNIEADDINAVIAKYYQSNFPSTNVYILASDKDYMQLGNEHFFLVDFKKNILNDKTKDPKNADGKYQLWHKIISGDKSDNIAPLKIQRKYIRPAAKTRLDEYINASKKDAEVLASNWKKFLKDIQKDPKLVNMKQLELNKKLVDFDNIPNKYAKVVIKQLLSYL